MISEKKNIFYILFYLITYVFLVILFISCNQFLFYKFSIQGIVPNLMIILVTIMSYINGCYFGILNGIIAGFFLDICNSNYFGINMLIYTIIGYIVGNYSYYYDENEHKLPVLMTVIFSFLCSLFMYVINVFLGNKINFFKYIFNIALIENMYTFVLTIFLYKFLVFINNKLKIFK